MPQRSTRRVARDVATATRRAMRRRLDRARPSVRTPEPAAEPGAADRRSVPSDYFHQALHELRTIELERVPKGARRALSVGASGGWYFDWFDRSVGGPFRRGARRLGRPGLRRPDHRAPLA